MKALTNPEGASFSRLFVSLRYLGTFILPRDLKYALLAPAQQSDVPKQDFNTAMTQTTDPRGIIPENVSPESKSSSVSWQPVFFMLNTSYELFFFDTVPRTIIGLFLRFNLDARYSLPSLFQAYRGHSLERVPP